MCLRLLLILSHVPAPKAHTFQGTIHRYMHSLNDQDQPVPDPPDPLLQHHSACPGPILQALPAPPGQACPPTRPAKPQTRPAEPPDPARQACRSCQPCPRHCQPSPPTLPPSPPGRRRPSRPDPTSRDKSSASAAMLSTRPASYLPASCSSAPVGSFPFNAVFKCLHFWRPL